MNDLERFNSVVSGEKPDYVPIIGFPGAPGMSDGCLAVLHRRLVAQGMPEWVDGCFSLKHWDGAESWHRYWGVTVPLRIDFSPHEPAKGFERTSRLEGDFEIIESENGSVTRQYVDNDETYVMPDFQVYPIRDRKSWEFYRERATPGALWPLDKIEEHAKKYDSRTKPLCICAGSTWGGMRTLMGTEMASTILYDDPHLVLDYVQWQLHLLRTYTFPVIERLKPEIVQVGEDICYKGGMLISPEHFRKFCAPYYHELSSFAGQHGCRVIAMDNDGNANGFVDLLEECGVNAMYPFESKAGNDLFFIRERHPDFILMGWLEKEVVNEGNEHMIETEIMNKVPALLEKGRYFPNLEHGMQPMATFKGLCRFMTLLHEVTENPEGVFPRT